MPKHNALLAKRKGQETRVPLKAPFQDPSGRWAYLTQAVATIVLVTRRNKTDNQSWRISTSLPVIVSSKFSSDRAFMQYDGIVLFIDFHAFRMSVLGVSVTRCLLHCRSSISGGSTLCGTNNRPLLTATTMPHLI